MMASSTQRLEELNASTRSMDLEHVTREEREQRLEAIRLAEQLQTLDLQLMVLREEERISRERADLIQRQDEQSIDIEASIAAITALSDAEQRLQQAERARCDVEEAAMVLSTASWWSAPAPSAPVGYPSLEQPPQNFSDAPPGYADHLQQRYGQQRRAEEMPTSSQSASLQPEMPEMRRTSSSQRILQERAERRRSASTGAATDMLPSYEASQAQGSQTGEIAAAGYPLQATAAPLVVFLIYNHIHIFL